MLLACPNTSTRNDCTHMSHVLLHRAPPPINKCICKGKLCQTWHDLSMFYLLLFPCYPGQSKLFRFRQFCRRGYFISVLWNTDMTNPPTPYRKLLYLTIRLESRQYWSAQHYLTQCMQNACHICCPHTKLGLMHLSDNICSSVHLSTVCLSLSIWEISFLSLECKKPLNLQAFIYIYHIILSHIHIQITNQAI